mmetsp:Transcript_18382/g.45135  ORF Transcript_18382/g.45135 Transcript_18382/m.45135 type:complete len:139 (-) Transcript_18382:141-557(-)
MTKRIISRKGCVWNRGKSNISGSIYENVPLQNTKGSRHRCMGVLEKEQLALTKTMGLCWTLAMPWKWQYIVGSWIKTELSLLRWRVRREKPIDFRYAILAAGSVSCSYYYLYCSRLMTWETERKYNGVLLTCEIGCAQ